MDWLVFGDDWGKHPSTTQHLVRHLMRHDRVIWVNSLGGRRPRMCIGDMKRLGNKAWRVLANVLGSTNRALSGHARWPYIIDPAVFPCHLNRLSRWINSRQLARPIVRTMTRFGIDRPTILAAIPTVALYLDVLPHSTIAYLRLDDYARMPGMDSHLVLHSEPRMYELADVIFATAEPLLPNAPWRVKSHYLPQGVDWIHFSQVDLHTPKERVLGFFGLIAEWMDFDLIAAVARRLAGWRLEFVGPIRYVPRGLASADNIAFRPAVAYCDLPRAIQRWQAAWVPFRVTELTTGVNPLKVREYLAAGIAVHCTPLPEAMALSRHVFISRDPAEIADWAEDLRRCDSFEARLGRRDAVRDHDWGARAARLRRTILACER